MLKSILIAIAGAGLASLASAPGSARAQPASNSESVSVRINFADLNLSSQQGAREMMGRIEGAARIICGESSANNDLAERSREHACVNQTVSDAVRSLDAPTVTALRDSRRGAETFVASR
ncbi:MAG TPA: UrcA family protein [Caulobacteraceae bacterium]